MEMDWRSENKYEFEWSPEKPQTLSHKECFRPKYPYSGASLETKDQGRDEITVIGTVKSDWNNSF